MDEKGAIALGNLEGEVAVLREMVKMLFAEIPANPMISAKIRAAGERARSSQPEGSPGRISIDHALNSLQPWTWMGKPPA